MKKNELILALEKIEYPKQTKNSLEYFKKQAMVYYYAQMLITEIKANQFQSSYSCVNSETGEIYNLCSNPFTKFKKNTTFALFRMNDLDHKVKNNHISFFTTYTLDSKFHPFRSNKIDINQEYTQEKTKEGFEKIKKVHREIYHDWTISHLGKTKHLRIKQIMVREPHKSTIPHAHSIYHIPMEYAKYFNDNIELMKEKFQAYWEKTCEKNQLGRRTFEDSEENKSFVEIDRRKGNAISYLLKYVSKNMNVENKYNETPYFAAKQDLREKYACGEIDNEELQESIQELKKLKLYDKDIEIEKLLEQEAIYLLENNDLSNLGKAFWQIGWVKSNKNRMVTMSHTKNSFQRTEFETFTKKTTYKEFAKKFGYDKERGVNFYTELWQKTYSIRKYYNPQGDFLKQSIHNKIKETHFIMLHEKEKKRVIQNFDLKKIQIQNSLKNFLDLDFSFTKHSFVNLFCDFYYQLTKNEKNDNFIYKNNTYENKLQLEKEFWNILKNEETEDKLLKHVLKSMIENNFIKYEKNEIEYSEDTIVDFYEFISNLLILHLRETTTLKTKNLIVYEKSNEDLGIYFDIKKNEITNIKNKNSINVVLYCQKQKFILFQNCPNAA